MSEFAKRIELEIVHVLFLDIVAYSKLRTNEQRESVEKLNQIVRSSNEFQEAEAAGRLIKLPTGDGMALVFYKSPEQPVECALEISRALKAHPELSVRMGVHSGPVSPVTDLNDRTNAAGIGINIAQRVMDCGDAGHILLSKRVAEDLEQCGDWQARLHDLGEVEVKHGARVHVFNLYTDEFGNPEVPEKVRQGKPEEQPTPILADGPTIRGRVFIHGEKPQSGLSSIVVIELRNDGNRTARGITATISHAETGCASFEAYPDWEQPRSNPRLNPRLLRCRHNLNPGGRSQVMQIPLCERSASPFTISIAMTVEDSAPTNLSCSLVSEALSQAEPVEFVVGRTESAAPAQRATRTPPSSPMAEKLLELILNHPIEAERGLTLILDSPNGALEMCFIPNTTERGGARSVKKSLLRPAIDELLRLRWLLPPEGDAKVQVYEFSELRP